MGQRNGSVAISVNIITAAVVGEARSSVEEPLYVSRFAPAFHPSAALETPIISTVSEVVLASSAETAVEGGTCSLLLVHLKPELTYRLPPYPPLFVRARSARCET